MGRKAAEKRLRRQRRHEAKRQQQTTETIQMSASFAGPLPPPAVLAEYEELHPGTADRLITLAEQQAKHRHGLETTVINGGVRAEHRGQWMGFILALLIGGGGFWLIANGQSALGIAAVIADLAAFVAVFVIGRRGQEKERREKWARFRRQAGN